MQNGMNAKGKSIVQLLFCPFVIIDKYIFQ